MLVTLWIQRVKCLFQEHFTINTVKAWTLNLVLHPATINSITTKELTICFPFWKLVSHTNKISQTMFISNNVLFFSSTPCANLNMNLLTFSLENTAACNCFSSWRILTSFFRFSFSNLCNWTSSLESSFS